MATYNQKTDLLFKQFTGVVNASQLDTFANSNSNKFPFQPYILGQDVLIENIPNDLSNISYPDPDNVGEFVYGIHALDLSFQSLNYTMGISYEIPNTPLIYYYKIQLDQALDTTPRSFYKDDGTNSNSSLLKDSIPFLYDPIYKSYFQRVYTNDAIGRINMYSGDLLWLFDYKSGFLQLYGSSTSAIQDWVDKNGPPRISVIVYNGDKGLENFSGITTNNLFMNLTKNITYNETLIKSFSSTTSDNYGESVSLSGNGNILIVSAPLRNSNGLNLNGEIIVYENLNSTWQQRDIIYGLDGDLVGRKTAINYDGTVIAFSNPDYNTYSGFVKIYKYINSTWSQIGVDLSGSNTEGQFGNSLALNNDGTVLAIGSPYYNYNGNYEGKVSIYLISNISVTPSFEILGPSNTIGFGYSIALSLDGNILAVGTPETDSYGTYKGEVNIYNITSGTYIDIGRIVGESNYDSFGRSISLNYDGYKILIGAPNSNSQGSNTGSAYLYEYIYDSNSDSYIWSPKGSTLYGEATENFFGIKVSINTDGSIIAIGAANKFTRYDGYVKVYKVNNIIELLYRLTHSNYPNNNGDYFGLSNSLSNNGKTLAIGSYSYNITYIYNIYDYVYNEGEINFIANNENISKIISTYDGNESTINFSVLNNNLLEDRLTINKDGIDISGNINANNLSTYIKVKENISLLINDSGYIRPSDNTNINSNCNKAKYLSYNADHNSHYMSLGYTSGPNRFKLNMSDNRPIEIDHSYESGYADYTHKLNNNTNGGYLYMSRHSPDNASVCITHNSTSNWTTSTGQILFHNGYIYFRNSLAKEIILGDYFYMKNLTPEGHEPDDLGQAYIVYNIYNKRLFYYYTGSDDRRKHNEVKINNALETIMKLEGLRYDMTDTMYSADYNGEIRERYRKEAGFIAQSVLKIDELKFTVTGGDYLDSSNNLVENSYQVKYDSIFTFGIVAIQELKREFDNKDLIVQQQKNEIDSLKEINLELENKVEILKNKLNELLSESGKEIINF